MDHYQAEDFAADESFLAYYLKSDPEAVAFWEHWIRTHPEKLDEVVAAESLLDLLTVRLPSLEFEQEKDRLEAYIDEAPVIGLPKRKPWLIAASILLVLSLGAGFWYANRTPRTEAPIVEWVHYSTPNGKKTKLTLSDGSTVILNAASTIHYPKAFVSDIREIRLEGEAYFSVQHEAQKPFLVRTGGLTTRVLGTEFNVSAYPEKAEISVALLKGKVQLEDTLHQQLQLVPGQQAVYQRAQHELRKISFDSLAVSGWKDGYLVFKNADFKTIAEALERTYGYQLILQHPTQPWQYTGTFHREDVRQVLETICFSKHLTYSIHQRTIYLRAEQ